MIDWLELWKELVGHNYQPEEKNRMLRYKEHARKRREREDPLLDYVLTLVQSGDSIIEIGPGNGRWTLPLARKARQVIAVEPSAQMAEILLENLKAEGLENVSVRPQPWEEVRPDRQDICLCAHSMYNSPDLSGFVTRMEAGASRLCAMAIRIPPADGVMAEMAGRIYGRRYDSPDAVIAFNALYQLGLNVNVMIEEGIVNWTNQNLEEALERAKRHLQVENSEKWDDAIKETLKRRLRFENEVWVWPDGMRSALLYWRPGRLSRQP